MIGAATRCLLGLLLLVGGAGVAAQAPAAPGRTPAIPARIAITAGFTALDQRAKCGSDRAESLYLGVQNDGASTLVVRSLRLLAPSDLALCAPPRESAGPAGPAVAELSPNIAVEAGRRDVIRVHVGLRDAPRQGTMPLILDVRLTATVEGAERSDRMLASDKVEIRIPGLSEALKLLGVPTLLLLPGLLAISTLFLVFKPASRDDYGTGKPAFWMLAISASAVLSWLYTFVTGRGGDFAERLDLSDVGRIWIISIAIGFAVGHGLRWWQKRKEKKAEAARLRKEAEAEAARLAEVAKRTPASADQPLDLFARLVLRGGFETPPPWAMLGTASGFLVDAGDGEKRWLIAQAVVKTRKPASAEKQEWDGALHELKALIDGDAGLSELVEFLLAKGELGGQLLTWQGGAGPRALGKNDSETITAEKRYYVAQM